jgi:hypothetical protein
MVVASFFGGLALLPRVRELAVLGLSSTSLAWWSVRSIDRSKIAFDLSYAASFASLVVSAVGWFVTRQ